MQSCSFLLDSMRSISQSKRLGMYININIQVRVPAIRSSQWQNCLCVWWLILSLYKPSSRRWTIGIMEQLFLRHGIYSCTILDWVLVAMESIEMSYTELRIFRIISRI